MLNSLKSFLHQKIKMVKKEEKMKRKVRILERKRKWI